MHVVWTRCGWISERRPVLSAMNAEIEVDVDLGQQTCGCMHAAVGEDAGIMICWLIHRLY